MLLAVTLTLAAAQPANAAEAAAAPGPAARPDCSYDLDAMLALDRNAFDQDIPDGGWRALSKDGCHSEAAELIRIWRHAKRDHNSILYWHEGQMRAFAGQTKEAIALFSRTYTAPEDDADFGWNHYVSGTIAFLRKDREHLQAAIGRLKTIPEPENNSFTRPDGTTVQMSWSPNLNVLEGFEKCWEKSYAEAYGNRDCSASLTL
ncbi:hypothetical protein [Erythrobacter sp. MTPC3]|uniref:hypothetical protein n=1 Tax=Erythrobacter sp. MTPC3 TaxID=3056564 RepID=UPI0036F2CCBB